MKKIILSLLLLVSIFSIAQEGRRPRAQQCYSTLAESESMGAMLWQTAQMGSMVAQGYCPSVSYDHPVGVPGICVTITGDACPQNN